MDSYIGDNDARQQEMVSVSEVSFLELIEYTIEANIRIHQKWAGIFPIFSVAVLLAAGN